MRSRRSGVNRGRAAAAMNAGAPADADALLARDGDEVADRAVTLRIVKALVSLVWRAGFTMRVAVPLQLLLAGTPPEQAPRAGPKGGFPLAREEMCWQTNLLTNMVR